MIALDHLIRGALYSFFSCSLICTMMDERTERYINKCRSSPSRCSFKKLF